MYTYLSSPARHMDAGRKHFSRALRRVLLPLLLLTPLLVFGGTGPTNAILFVTQIQIPDDFATIGAVFGNQQPDLESCGRGGDLYIRYPNGTTKNLTRAAGFGQAGLQGTNAIAVRQPCVYWDGKKAIFSMVVGAPTHQYDYTYNGFWQLYEITNFTDPAATPIITKVPNQPTNFDNVSPIYGSDDRIIFTSDRPRNGEAQLFPQLDEYEEQPTVTGLWSLQPTNGNLFMINHTPSGAFSPMVDSAGRIVFSRWDHLQRDQQADTDWENGTNITYGCFNWSDESPASVATTNVAEEFPEPRSVRTDLLAGTDLVGEGFNQFFPWAINQDGTDEETLNHIGRHEIGGSYCNGALNDDPNVQDLYYYGENYNTNTVENFLMPREDPRTPGLFYGIDAPEFGTHCAGQIVSITGSTNMDAFYMRVNYLTPRSTHEYADSPDDIPPDDTGLYRNPMMTSDGYLIAAHTAYTQYAEDTGSETYPATPYDFRIKTLVLSNGFYAPATLLTTGLVNSVSYWSPDELIYQTNQLWELEPVEVIARARPVPYTVPIPDPELAAFAAAKVNVDDFQSYLRLHQLAVIVSRDVTTRDEADHQQPFNLHVTGTTHQTIGAPGKVYDVAWMQLFQADQLRSLNYGDPSNPRQGRRVLAQYLHDPAVDNPSFSFGPTSSVSIGPDGSMAAIVPARRAMSWQLTDTNGVGVVRERYWLTFAAGEVRSCTSCHGINEKTQAGLPAPTNTPVALISLLNYWKTNTSISAASTVNQGTNHFQVTFIRRPAETGVTYHVQSSADLRSWTDIATYAGTNIILSAAAMEVSRVGSPNESVTVRETGAINQQAGHFLRVSVTKP